MNLALLALRELDNARAFRKERIIVAATYEVTRMKACSALAHQDFATVDILAGKTLDAEAL